MRVSIVTKDKHVVLAVASLLSPEDSYQVYGVDEFRTLALGEAYRELRIVDAPELLPQELIDLLRRCHRSTCPLLLVVREDAHPLDELWKAELPFQGLFDIISWPLDPAALAWKLEMCDRILRGFPATPATRESEAHFRVVAEWAPYMMWTHDETGSANYFNKYGLEFIGSTESHLQGFNWRDFVHPEDQERTIREFSQALLERKPYRIVTRVRRADGQYRWIECLGGPRYWSDGTYAGVVAAGFDVTERREVEIYLRNREQFVQELAESLPLLIWQTDAQGRPTYYNSRWCEYTGHNPEQDGYDHWTEFVHPDDRERVLAYWKICLQKGESGHLEYRLREAATGRYRWHRTNAMPVRNRDGVVVKWYGSNTDIDDVILSSQEVKRLCSQLENTNRLKDEFLATLSHELRTPLNVIGGHAELLAESTPSAADWRDSTEAIIRNTKDLARLVEDLLDVSKIINGKMSIKPSLVNLKELITSVVDGLRFSWRAKNLILETYFSKDLPTVIADGDRIRQVIWNLVTNSIKFTPSDGSIVISARQTPDAEVVIEVTDTGAGINPEFIPHLFERFSQQDSSSARRHGGLGLGLALVRHIVELHGGTVQAHSAGPGMGSTFTVHLPLRRDEFQTPRIVKLG